MTILKNAIKRFTEIKKIDSTNIVLLFVLLFTAYFVGETIDKGDSWEVILPTFLFRLILLPTYFFVKFTNKRFNIITIIFIILLFIGLNGASY